MIISEVDNNGPVEYVTIERNGEGRLTEKMSRFLSFAFEVKNSADARNIVKEMGNRYHDARHVCWAYMLGAEHNDYLSNDNGEPSGTAGKPILGQINSFGLTDVLVVVVRYFGGIKLGTPGLINAYRESARMALENSGRRTVTRCNEIGFEVGYESLDKVMRLVKERNLPITGQNISNLCEISISVPLAINNEIVERLNKIDGLKIKSICLR